MLHGYAYIERKEKLKAKIPELDIAYRSLIGDREEQQDCFGVFQNEKGTFAIVCDGMGGMEAGSLASRVAVQIFAREIAHFREEAPAESMLDILDRMDYSVYRKGQEKNIRTGTTAVFIYLREEKLYWCSVGDSRLYICRGNRMVSATRDHNYDLKLERMRREGTISQKEYLAEHGKGGRLLSYVGIKGIRIRDILREPFILQKEDVLILCSDGLYKNVREQQIQEIVCSRSNMEACALALEEKVQLNASRQRDNTTFIMIKKK